MSNKTPEIEKFLDELSLLMFGRSHSLAKVGNSCVTCEKPAIKFKDELSKREYSISKMCQECQDSVFG